VEVGVGEKGVMEGVSDIVEVALGEGEGDLYPSGVGVELGNGVGEGI